MKSSFRSLATGSIGLISLAVTLLIFFLKDFEKSSIYWWALFFVVTAEIALFSGLIILGNLELYYNKVLVRSGVSSVLFLYFFATTITTLFVGAFKNNVNNFLLIQIIIVAIAAIITISIVTFSKRINSLDQSTMSNRKLLEVCETKAYAMFTDSRNRNYEKQLYKLYESIRYGDKIGSSSVDEKIVTQITNLEKVLHTDENPVLDINTIFEALFANINQRNIEVAGSKRGGV